MKTTQLRDKKTIFWRQHIELANQYPDGVLKYCRANGLASQTFYKWKLKSKDMHTPIKLAAMQPFAEVHVCKPEVLRRQGLPDAKWLAEFVLHLSKAAQ